MTSRTPLMQRRPRGAWRTTWARVLCPALAVLLAAAVMCLGHAEHGAGDDRAGHHVTAVHLHDCPTDDACCAPAVHPAAGVLAAPVQPMPALLPRMPDLPRWQGSPALLAQPPPASGAPDLHVLQVLRT
ncbi:hypothetical protein [Streptomyces violarus]|uniref:Secreted protein n=1 Tax=Streptomyces violarus TaxID=67380 RepID=A0A7W4ZN56_9ACTN|nr:MULTISPECIES: hypothetical protein [Streptomyces]MBB3075426.1 hypothetical protein [Streptomyces violarus]WRT98030.1 hypothetical protein VJ737_10215 [Streptomyces sp. CGMCC 4.1772]